MNLRQFASKVVPDRAKQKIRHCREIVHLKQIKKQNCEVTYLRAKSKINLDQILSSSKFETEWQRVARALGKFDIPNGTGGVNPGDRKAIYWLIRNLRPKSVLEIGTHIGASTVYIAAALRNSEIEDNERCELITVDIQNVNSLSEKPWKNYGMVHSPLQMIQELEFEGFVSFVTSTSAAYAISCHRKFDFIFLDGDHSAATVYTEIPLALKLLNGNGVILLHDYFPNEKPLWSDNSVVQGPFIAVNRFRKEGVRFSVLPLGSLPWSTKLNSNVSSLALLAKN